MCIIFFHKINSCFCYLFISLKASIIAFYGKTLTKEDRIKLLSITVESNILNPSNSLFIFDMFCLFFLFVEYFLVLKGYFLHFNVDACFYTITNYNNLSLFFRVFQYFLP